MLQKAARNSDALSCFTLKLGLSSSARSKATDHFQGYVPVPRKENKEVEGKKFLELACMTSDDI
jgi:hypothetical protein